MAMITGTFKSLLAIKFKARHDTYTDQFNRIFMVKMAMVSSMLCGLNWFKDTVVCIIPKTSKISDDFVKETCWIQGFYIYKDVPISNTLEYYGIPRDISMNGVNKLTGLLCNTVRSSNCEPLIKTFYLQYQWFPFYIAVIGFLYYVPYILFRFINTDLISLKTTIKAVDPNVDEIVKNYFNYQINPPFRMRLRLFSNVIVKLIYLCVNVIAFVGTNTLLNGDFKDYGSKWMSWSKNTNEKAYDYTHTRQRIKPGNILLPTFGFCDVVESAKDKITVVNNDHRFICEISQNVLYQYVLIMLWFLFIFGMVVSAIGFITQLVDHVITVTCFLSQGSQAKKVYQSLTLRECEYLEYIRKKDLSIYTNLIRKLKEDRLDRYGNGFGTGHEMNSPYDHSKKLLDEEAPTVL